MATAHKVRPTSYLSPQYINGIYIPTSLLLVGVAIVKIEWIPYAAVVALVLGAWKVYNNRECFCAAQSMRLARTIRKAPLTRFAPAEVKKALKPDVFQEFPLKEKTVLSHNVAM